MNQKKRYGVELSYISIKLKNEEEENENGRED